MPLPIANEPLDFCQRREMHTGTTFLFLIYCPLRSQSKKLIYSTLLNLIQSSHMDAYWSESQLSPKLCWCSGAA